jgi:pimeloyl-ACP methyl ester carboxylesterase
MGLDLSSTAAANKDNANFMLAASELAYFPVDKGCDKFKAELGLDAKLYSVGNTQAFVGTDADNVVVAFRGTESPLTLDGIKDWLLTDANNFLIVPEGRIGTDFAAAGVGARFHRGFMTALGDIWDPMFQAVQAALKEKKRPVWLTGHSLGGALAVLAAWRFERQFTKVHQIVTFGGPMVGNDAAVKALDKQFRERIYRFVNFEDLVPRLPTVSLVANSYAHCLTEVLIGGAGATVKAAATVFDLMKETGLAATEGPLNASVMDRVWSHLKGNINAHDLGSYRGAIDQKFASG